MSQPSWANPPPWFNRNAGPVAHTLPDASPGVEQPHLAAIGLAADTNRHGFHPSSPSGSTIGVSPFYYTLNWGMLPVYRSL